MKYEEQNPIVVFASSKPPLGAVITTAWDFTVDPFNCRVIIKWTIRIWTSEVCNYVTGYMHNAFKLMDCLNAWWGIKLNILIFENIFVMQRMGVCYLHKCFFGIKAMGDKRSSLVQFKLNRNLRLNKLTIQY